MKLFLILLLCGAAGCLASPKCTKEEVRSCTDGYNDDILTGYCSLVRCWMDFFNRCQKSLFGPYFPHKDYEKMLSTVCVKENPMHKKYYENLKCIASVLQGDDSNKEFNCTIHADTKEEMCKNLPGKAKCTSDYFAKVCGQDAGEVAQVAISPFIVYLFSGCIPAFDMDISSTNILYRRDLFRK